MKYFKIALSPGHTATRQGASRGNITEYGLSAAIIGDLTFKLSKAGHVAHLIGSDSNADQVKNLNTLLDEDISRIKLQYKTGKLFKDSGVFGYLYSSKHYDKPVKYWLERYLKGNHIVSMIKQREKRIIKGYL
jgi:hypothetical protein